MKPHVQDALHDLSHRNQLGPLLNSMGLTGKGVEVGTLVGTYAEILLSQWRGHLYCVDPWENQKKEVYFDGANLADMNQIWATVNAGVGRNPRCTLLKMYSLNAAGYFADGELDFVYLDGNHAVGAVRDDIAAWWPKVKVGGIVSGHDFNVRYDHETNSDALTAVSELAEVIGVRTHVTWCTSWYFIKTAEADEKFREACIKRQLPRPVYTDNLMLFPTVVLPVAKFDWNLAVKWLQWTSSLPNQDYKLVVLCSPELSTQNVDELWKAAKNLDVRIIPAEKVKELGYFGTPNQMIKAALELTEERREALLWVEADSVPMRASWYREIASEYQLCNRPFLGEILKDGQITHMTGNGVYHPNWRTLAPSLAALGQEACGWDTLCAHDIVPRAHPSKTIQQIWRPGPFDAAAVNALIRPETALFHQCKDGTLIDVLSTEKIPLQKALCETTYEVQVKKYDGPTGFDSSRPVTWPIPPKVEILIVTFARDIDFLHYLMRSIQLYSVGFAGITVAVPREERGNYSWMPPYVKVAYYDDAPGKGMLMHLAMKTRADELCPDAAFIMHADADNMFWESFTPQDYMPYNKPILVREPYAVCGVRNTNRMYWKETTKRATGIDPEWETMVRHPQVHLRAVYKRTREIIEAHTGMGFTDYVLSGQNAFPQSYCEFNALGTVALKEFASKYTIVDYDRERDARECGVNPLEAWQYIYRAGRDKMIETWSHGGIRNYEKTFEKIMRGQRPEFMVK